MLKAAKKTLRQPTVRAEFSLIRHTESIMGSKEKHFFLGGGGGGGGGGEGNRLIASEKLIKVYVLWPSRYRLNK